MGRRRMKNAQRFFYDEYLQVADNYGNAYIWDATDGFASRLIMGRSNNQDLTYVYDGNKNVSGIVASCGIGEAHCEYGLFGGIAKHQGTSAIVDPWRFSCEYFDDELDVSYYNFRPYSSLLGRWLGRDEIQESAGANLYAYLFNAPSISFDYLGLLSFDDIQWGKLIDVSTGFTFKNPLKFSVLSKFEELTIQLNGSKEDENCCFKVGVAGFLSLNLISTRELFPKKLIGSIAGHNPADWGRVEGGVDVGGSVKVCRCNRKWQVQKPSEIFFGVFVKGSIGSSSSTTRGYNRFSPSVIMPTFHIPNKNPMVKGFWASAQLDGKIVFEVDPFRMNQSESGVFFSASAGYRIGIWSAQWNFPARRIFP